MKKTWYLLFTALFMGACLLPDLGLLAFGPSPAAGNEAPIAAPSLVRGDGSWNVAFLSDAAAWFSRSFGFRRELITADSALKARLFHSSSQSQVALGQGDWLYYAETLDDYSGADRLTDRQAYCMARSLRLAQDYAGAQGAAFLFTIAPNKASVCPQGLPAALESAPAAEPYAQPAVTAIQEQGVAYADLFTPLGKQPETLYFTLDSHWTNKGAALAHDVLLRAWGLPEEDAFAKPGAYQPTHRGDLYEMLYPASGRLDLEFHFDQPLAFAYAGPIRDVDDLRIETTSGAANRPLLMFRDSFGNALHGLMAESFSSALFSRAMPYNLELIGQTGARYVAVEIVERNLPLLAGAPFRMPAPQVEASQAPWWEGLAQEALPCLGECTVHTEPSGPYQKVSAATAAACDRDSPVYLVRVLPEGPAAWEAFPICQGDMAACAAYLPGDWAGEDSLCMVFRQGGQWGLARPAQTDQP